MSEYTLTAEDKATAWCPRSDGHEAHTWTVVRPGVQWVAYCPGRVTTMDSPERPETILHFALEQAAWQAFRDPADPRRLAVVVRAWEIEGYGREWLADEADCSRGEALERMTQALYRRHRRVLDAEARGLLRGLRGMIECGVVTMWSLHQARYPPKPPEV